MATSSGARRAASAGAFLLGSASGGFALGDNDVFVIVTAVA